jgi:hypothetical protein
MRLVIGAEAAAGKPICLVTGGVGEREPGKAEVA